MKLSKKYVIIVSVILPLAVAALFGIKIEGYDFKFFPPIYAGINALTSLVLVFAVIAIKNNNKARHEALIKFAMLLSLVFLSMYIAYHITSDATHFGGEGVIKYAYYIILISHILLSVVVIPLVLFSFMYGINNELINHKKIVRFAFPLWLYVTISGVIVYIMISPYYI